MIKGIPCDFIEFEKIIIPPNPLAAETEDSESYITNGPPADRNFINIRHMVWNVIGKQDEV